MTQSAADDLRQNDSADPMNDLLALVARVWGYRELRPLQHPAMQAFMARRDSLVVLPTGGGKSLCYQAPALHLAQRGEGPTVVVSPLIALMKDQVDSLRELGVAASQLDSSLSADDRQQVTDDLRNGRLNMLFVSPERLVSNDWLRGRLREARVKAFAIDEAHCISHWGHDFRPEYRQLARLKEYFPDAAVHAFTATATEQVRSDIVQQLGLRDPEILVGNFDRPNLTYRVLPRRDLLGQIREVLERHAGEAGIIYCPRRKDVDDISAALSGDRTLGRKVGGYHAGMTPELRQRIQTKFIEEECDLIVATIAFGMGIDRSNIRFVLHTAMPKSVEAYQQETGRAGRDGLEAECVLLYSGQDAVHGRILVEKSITEATTDGIKVDPGYLASSLRHIDDMDRFARGASCRHKTLVEYFGQTYQGPEEPSDDGRALRGCGACDTCLGDTAAVADGQVIAQKILSCIARTDQNFGAAHITSVLRGENTEAVRRWGHQNLTTYGLLSSYSKGELRDFIYQLLGQEALAKEDVELRSGHIATIFKLNTASWEIMKGQRQVRLLETVHKPATEARRSRGEAISWEGVDQELFQVLRAWRKQTATERGVPPFVVFSDATLRELARLRPTTLQHLRVTRGVGETKLKEFGVALASFIKAHCEAHNLTTNVAPPPPRALSASASDRPSLSRPNPVKEAAFRLFQNGDSTEDAAIKTGRARSTITEYLAEFIEREKPATIECWVVPEVYEKVRAAADKVGVSALRPVFIALDEKVPYDQIRLVVAHLRALARA